MMPFRTSGILRWWPDFSLRTKGFIVVSIPLFAMLASFAFSYLVNREQDRASAWVGHTLQVRFNLDKLLDRLNDAERAVRTYQSAHSEEFLAPYQEIKQSLPRIMTGLTALVASNPVQSARLREVQSLADRELALLAKLAVPPVGSERPASSPEQTASFESQRGMETLRRAIVVMDEQEQQLLDERTRQLAHIERWRSGINAGGVIFGVLGAVLAAELFSQGIVRRVHLLRASADQLAAGLPLPDFPAGEDEIGVLARHLHKAAQLLSERGLALDESLRNLRQSESLYRALARNFPNGSIFVFDHDLRYLVADGHGLAAQGTTREALEGRTLRELAPPEIVVVLEPLYRATLAGETQAREFTLSQRPHLVHFSPLRDEAGVVYAGLVVTQDVSEQKRSEETLRQARDEAQRANAAKSIFLSRMSHELRTPLNAILGFGQILELHQLPDQQGECVRHLLKGGRYLLSLVDEVLDLARVEAGELRLKPAAVRLDVLARECAGFVTGMLQARAITCTVEDSPALQTPVWADKHRLRQVLLNLISNAIKYNRQGGQVYLGGETTADGRVRFKVRDTGRGMSPQDLARLFVPFERLGQELGKVEGTGLGLVVSKQLVEAMGGTLGVESQVDEGTTFWIELPGVSASVPSEPTPEAAHPASDETAPTGPATVLYIEDNLSNLQVVTMLLSRARPQWRLISARDGYSGVQIARDQRPECILLDLQLPGMKGDAVLAKLRAHEETARIPVFVVSADVMTYNRETLLALGATGYLPKPFQIDELLEKLDRQMPGTHRAIGLS